MAKEAVKLAASRKEPSQSKPATTTARPKKSAARKKTSASEKAEDSVDTAAVPDTNAQSLTALKKLPAETPGSRKASSKARNKDNVQETVEIDKATSDEPAPKKPNEKRKRSAQVKEKDITPASSKTRKKRRRSATPKLEQDPDELPHGLGKLWKPSDAGAQTTETGVPKLLPKEEAIAEATGVKSEELSPPVVDPITASAHAAAAATTDTLGETPTKKPLKKKAHPYGLTPGVTPFPDWVHPTPEECQEVNDLLSTIHGNVTAPAKIPEPSLTFAGCGEVPCVLDALIRTYLSAATSGGNSTRAFKGLLEEYGQQETGIGKGSVNWDAVRRSDVKRVFKAIQSGGLADVKSKNIKKILDMVYAENEKNRAALENSKDKEAKDGGEEAGLDSKVLEIARAHSDHLSLDHLHGMSKDEAFNHMLDYPGIGVKTASCVTLFCLRRPSFAVDTHVFRLCQWLGWVPEKANRDTTYQHCEVRVPDELKYSLHQLLIMHGKKCGRCRAITGESSSGWADGCVIDHLVKRTGVRKGGDPSPKKKAVGKSPGKGKSPAKVVGKKRKRADDDEDEEQETEEDEDFDD